jgi:sulfate permease
MMNIVIILLSVFFAINMGAASFASSFAAAVGSKAINRITAAWIFIFLVVLGAVMFGSEVSVTLSRGIVSKELITPAIALIIIFCATLSLFTANLMKIPQSTSLSTIAAIMGAGFYFSDVNMTKINWLLFCWVGSVVLAFIFILMFSSYVYPPRRTNFWIYEKIINNQDRLKWFVIVTACYNSFSQGANNVANVVGPLNASGQIGVMWGLFVLGIIFGCGAFVFKGTMETSSEKIVPLGLLTATIINFVSGTISIVASKMGIPQPAVILYTMAVFAVGSIKHGPELTIADPLAKKTLFTWGINPIITFLLSYLLVKLIH